MILSTVCSNCKISREITKYDLICNAPMCDSILCLNCYEVFNIIDQSTIIGRTFNCDQIYTDKNKRRYTHRCNKHKNHVVHF